MRAPGARSETKQRATDKAKRLRVKSKKKCSKCGTVHPIEHFGSNTSSADGRQSYCNDCKRGLAVRRHEVNVPMRLKHHMATRVATQLGRHAPNAIAADLEQYVGYKMTDLARHLDTELQVREGKQLREALKEGYHVDHIVPLHSFPVIREGMVDWESFRNCWKMDNLRAISAQENLSKGGKIHAAE